MEIYLIFRHMEATDGLKTYAENKAGKLKKYLMKPLRMNMIFSKQRFAHRVEITLFEKDHAFKAQGVTTDMYASVDQAMHTLEQQLKRYKEKMRHHKNYFKSRQGLLAEAADLFDDRLSRERRSKRSWKKPNRVLRKKVA